MTPTPTATEVSESATGFDELAVEKWLGFDLYEIAETRPMKFMRGLVFVHLRHQGIPDKDAKQQVLDMPMGDLNDYFTDEDVVPEDPDSDVGKDD